MSFYKKMGMKRIMFLMLVVLPFTGFANIDSVGTELVEGKKYILHRVEKGEGLYGIARIYGSTPTQIQQINNLGTTILELGQVLKVPAKASKASVANPAATSTKAEKYKTEPIVQNPKLKLDQYATHVVKKGETLYKIATKYDISVTELKEINNLNSNSLNHNQKLKVPKQGRIIANPDIIEPVEEDSKNVKVESSKGTANVKVSTQNHKHLNSIEVSETGIAGWINDKSINNKKSIALHKTAPIGTIIRITNLMNNKSVYVKVIGTLPETGDNENTVIVISKAAVNMLGVIDQKFRVTLTYSIPKE
jgi:LysM repeat protein